MPVTIAVLGDGAWGTAAALILARSSDHRVRLWSARAENGARLREVRENIRYLPGVPIPKSIELVTDSAAAIADAELWVSAIPTIHLRTTLTRFAALNGRDVPIVSLTKGIELATFRRPSEIIAEVLGSDRVAALSGPSHAEEVARGMPTSVVVAGSDSALTAWIQSLFITDRFRVYTNPDLVGVELAGALKNVIGIAAGICDGLGFGDNAKSALLTRGIVEMIRFGMAHGAEHDTFHGLAGIGDLITTCFSPHGRNRRVGERLGRGETLATILGDTAAIAEGVTTARSVHERASNLGLELPIATIVFRVLYEGLSPLAGVSELMTRRSGSERLRRT
ncbi:MAG TPA: NAD(P)H-dependent glycerol-3-phosphate dehydrogenase [Gemmataceae bacterium]|jgi:glycerol-3-phosphate dehydrogenase (NAD(P)+)|nr:NAD(P)H-dependent glycerol-3-phosphate dehydrogenase [Gemmataceae bacterium]